MFKKLTRFLFYFLLISLLSGYITFKFLSSGLKVEVPDVTGKSVSEAKGALEKVGLSLKVKSERFTPGIPAGQVIMQEIPQGSAVSGGSEVKVIASKGPDIQLIPSVTGNNIATATRVLKEQNLSIEKTILVHSDSIDEGTVIAQNPAPDEWKGQGITLIASMGPYDVSYYTPFFVGMTKDEALQLVSELGINAEFKGEEDYNTVVEQKPAPGDDLKMGGTLRLTLGKKEN